jgi:hypothetical protein
MINIDNINQDVKLTLDEPSIDELHISSSINLTVQNISKKNLYFPVDLNVKLFTIQDNKWLEVENKVIYAGNPAMLGPNEPLNLAAYTSIDVFPVFVNEGKKEFLRIVIIGEELTENGERTDIPVAATLDLILNP